MARLGELLVSTQGRSVGRILHKNPDPKNIPCHRVVNARGKVATSYVFGGAKIQSKKLVQEGVEFFGDKVNLQQCLYKRNH